VDVGSQEMEDTPIRRTRNKNLLKNSSSTYNSSAMIALSFVRKRYTALE
jgi:hypothetical protein